MKGSLNNTCVYDPRICVSSWLHNVIKWKHTEKMHYEMTIHNNKRNADKYIYKCIKE